jgi:DNA processing protein
VAVVAGGVQHIYPPENRDLTAAIAAQGAVVSENGLSMVPQAAHFPRRNRIISGMAQAVLVVEANMKSGSLITARLAGEQGREVLAVPGSPLDPRCAGTNHLLKEGATLAGSVDDILAVLHAAPPQLSESTSRSLAPLPVTEQDTERWRPVLLELLSPVPVPLDELLRQSGAGLPVVQTILLELQLAGRLEWHRGNKVSLLAVIH